MKASLTWICAGWLAMAASFAANTAAVDEVLKLAAAGVPEDTIVAFVQSQKVDYKLTSEDIIALRNKGVAGPVLTAMLQSKVTATPPQAAASTVAAPSQSTAPIAYPGQPQTSATTSAAPLQSPVAAPAPVAPAAPTAPPPPPPLSGDAAYFAPELGAYGRWILVEDGQWHWQPSVVLSSPAWRPYWDAGHWIYTDQGWYWASDYPWGGITFHYGRWHLHARHGWLWYPDRAWAPSWVVWRSGGEYCGWAPLPPGAVFDVSTGAFRFRGQVVTAGFDFGLGWHHFNFSLMSEMGARPILRLRTEAEIQTVFHQSTVLHGYTVHRAAGRTHVVNRGIDSARVAAARGRPMPVARIHEKRVLEPGRSRERVDPRRNRIDVYRR